MLGTFLSFLFWLEAAFPNMRKHPTLLFSIRYAQDYVDVNNTIRILEDILELQVTINTHEKRSMLHASIWQQAV